jgi:hypothetical protein
MTDIGRSTSRNGTVGDLAELTRLRGELRGQVCLQGDAGYDEARTIWNAMIDRSPDVVVRCQGAADVIRTMKLCERP